MSGRSARPRPHPPVDQLTAVAPQESLQSVKNSRPLGRLSVAGNCTERPGFRMRKQCLTALGHGLAVGTEIECAKDLRRRRFDAAGTWLAVGKRL